MRIFKTFYREFHQKTRRNVKISQFFIIISGLSLFPPYHNYTLHNRTHYLRSIPQLKKKDSLSSYLKIFRYENLLQHILPGLFSIFGSYCIVTKKEVVSQWYKLALWVVIRHRAPTELSIRDRLRPEWTKIRHIRDRRVL